MLSYEAIGAAGEAPSTEEQRLRLQRLVIGDTHFTNMSWRDAGGFVGGWDHDTNAPLPEPISALTTSAASPGLIALVDLPVSENPATDPARVQIDVA